MRLDEMARERLSMSNANEIEQPLSSHFERSMHSNINFYGSAEQSTAQQVLEPPFFG